MRIGLFGGSFDPVHNGHLLLAECCREQCRLDQVWFVPAAVAPHKRQQQPFSAAEDRVEMLSLAIAGQPSFAVSEIEIERGGVSYTVDTLRAMAEEESDAELFLLMGADTLADLVNWHQPAEILQLATPVVVGRASEPAPDYEVVASLVDAERVESFRQYHVKMPQVELSSSEIRRRVATGESIRYQTPRAVEKYIETHGLYRDSDAQV